MQPQERRKANIRLIVRTAQLYTIFAAVAVFFVPYILRGTEFHERASDICTQTGLAMLLAPALANGIYFVVKWLRKHGRAVDDPLYIVGLFCLVPIGTAMYYVAYQLMSHDGSWAATLAFSKDAFIRALSINLVLIFLFGKSALETILYLQGEGILIKSGKPTPFSHFLVMLLIPILVLITVAAVF